MSHPKVGVRRESKNRWERRTPLTPENVRNLHSKRIEVWVQPSSNRIYTDAEYQHGQAKIRQDLSECSLVVGVKEMPNSAFDPGGAYMFFSHTHKAQAYNMPMLAHLLDQGCSLIDYELIRDDDDHRLIAFGRFAGLASAIDSLWALGKRFEAEGFRTPLLEIKQAWGYDSLVDAKKAVTAAGRKIGANGLNPDLPPLTCLIAGTGNSGRGAREILDLLPVRDVEIEHLAHIQGDPQAHRFVHLAVLGRRELVRRKTDRGFGAAEYRAQPELYESRLDELLPHADLLIHTIYWEPQFPRLVPLQLLDDLWAAGKNRVRLISDVSCDIHGSVEATIKPTTPDSPTYLWRPGERSSEDVWTGKGPLIMAVDNLPCELPRESSEEFGEALQKFVPQILKAIDARKLRVDRLPPELARAVIAANGELAPDYAFLKDHLP